MLNKNLLLKALDAQAELRETLEVDVTILSNGFLKVWARPLNYGQTLSEDARHAAIRILTPLVGRLDKKQMLYTDGEIWFEGATEEINVTIARADVCKILGYKVTKTQRPKLVEVQGEFEEEVERVAITECDVQAGRASKEDITEEL